MKFTKAKLLNLWLMISIVLMGTLCIKMEAKAATSGTLPCSEGSVVWTLSDSGDLVLSGNGTLYVTHTNVLGVLEEDWYTVWAQNGLNIAAVKSVSVQDGSVIYLNTLFNMFDGFENCKTIDMSGFDTSKLSSTIACGMFEGCKSLTKLDISGINTEKITDMSKMFSGCESLASLDVSGFDTANVENMSEMFMDCKSLTSLDVSGFETGNVKYMSEMFSGCVQLENIDVSQFDTEQVTIMEWMFYQCSSLSELDVSGFDTSNVTTMGGMFRECEKLTTIDVSGFDTGNVETFGTMFMDCTSLSNVDVSGFNTSKAETMHGMFSGCTQLVAIDVSGFDTSNVTAMYGMFRNCEALVSIDVSGFDTRNVEMIEFMFYGCNSLKELDLSNLYIAADSDGEYILYRCENLEKFVSAQGINTYEIFTDGGQWYDDEMNIYEESEFVVLESCTTIYKVKEFYNINYVCQGELIECPATYAHATGVEQLGSANSEHYTFDGWYLDESYTTPITSIPIGRHGDITVYGKMTPNKYVITYHNTEEAINSDILEKQYTYGTQSRIPVLMRDCHIFKGWYLDSAYTKAFLGITPTTNGDLTLYAKWEEAHNYDMTNGKVIAEPTATTEGTIEYTCKNCTHTTTAVIPKLTVDNVSDETLAVTDESILDTKDDNDIAGSSFAVIQARADKTTKKSIRLKWNQVKNADGYKIYGNKCGKKNRYEYIKTISNGNTTKYTQKKLKKGTYYKYIVRAYKLIDGQEVTIAVSKTIHVSTTGGKFGNAKSVKIKTDKKMKSKKGVYTLTIKKNKKYTIKASEVKQSKKIKKHRAIKFESSDASIATVSSKGVVKGKKKGTCYIYAYAQNGAYQKIKVKVK